MYREGFLYSDHFTPHFDKISPFILALASIHLLLVIPPPLITKLSQGARPDVYEKIIDCFIRNSDI